MPRRKSKAVPEGNDPVPQDTSGLLGGITLEELRPTVSKALVRPFDKYYGLKLENPREMKATYQRLAGAEHDARQPRLATEVDVPTDKKTRKRAEYAANSMFARLGADYEIRNKWFFAILEAMTTG